MINEKATHLEDTRYKGKKRVVQTEQNQQVANGAWKFFSWPWQGWIVHKHHIHLFKDKNDILHVQNQRLLSVAKSFQSN